MSKVKVPGGAFYAGEGLNVDLITRTVSADGGSSTTTPDWNQNNESASDYIKNRPGGYEAVQMSDIYNATITVTYATGGNAENVYELLNNVGSACTVILDGTTYENMVVMGSVPQTYIGDKTLTNYPFIITQYVNIDDFSEGFNITTQTSASSHTLIIKVESKAIVKFDAKYLPNGNVINVDYDGSFTNSSTNSITSKNSVAIGNNNVVKSNNTSTNIGNNFVVGSNNKNYLSDSCVIGSDNDNMVTSSAIFMAGVGLKDSPTIVALGSYNENINSACALYVGIGDSDAKRKTGFAVLKNGGLIIPSSTSGSTKYFKITVDDTGTLTATEV